MPPPPPAPPVLAFGVANWVKDIKTTTHNTNKVELVDLRDPDPANPGAKDWANGEPAEVETEWRILQTEFANAGNPKGELKDCLRIFRAATKSSRGGMSSGSMSARWMPNPEKPWRTRSGRTGSTGGNGHPMIILTPRLTRGCGHGGPSTVVVVGEFLAPRCPALTWPRSWGLIDHIPDGDERALRRENRGGGRWLGIHCPTTGAPPDGSSLIPSPNFLRHPTVPGTFTFTVSATDPIGVVVSREYTVTIAGDAPPVTTHTVSTGSLRRRRG